MIRHRAISYSVPTAVYLTAHLCTLIQSNNPHPPPIGGSQPPLWPCSCARRRAGELSSINLIQDALIEFQALSGHLPGCSVISWMAILNRLSTEDRLVMFGMKSSSTSSLCMGIGTHDDVFFECPMATQIKVYVHQLWLERNYRKFQNLSCSPGVVANKISDEVRSRSMLKGYSTLQVYSLKAYNSFKAATLTDFHTLGFYYFYYSVLCCGCLLLLIWLLIAAASATTSGVCTVVSSATFCQ
ncbi:hypothetical protein RHSIM_Rhsim07G0147700 [Rhododendron simsii]|uniref:Reverse transcriptase zinc-binding domain-containing protein n=1 Tax=Rhododendron simsii TaxID=118357 RepID=A0A834LJ61_RHOSS|nr:hypothetical protein RHSIM_Rhsim07G0147700 [Rhododendron simsii]